jgi:hypothetical protein
MLYKIWSRFLTWLGDVYLAVEPPKVKAKHIRKCLDVVQSGDILCRKYIYYLDGYFIKGAYSHSGIVINNTTMIDPRLGEAYITLADNTKLKTVFGWSTTKRIEDYIKENLN